MEGFAPPQFLHNPKAAVSTVGYGDDSGAHATFDDEMVKNEFRSEREGRVVFDHYYVLEMQWPGDNTKTFKYRFKAEELDVPRSKAAQYTQRFSRQWDAFRNSRAQTPDGTPIEMWPPLDKKRVYEMKANKIFTVEQVAALTDSTGPNLGLDWRKLRDAAQAFINPAASVVQVSKLSSENEELKHKMAAMEQQLAALSQNPSLTVVKKRRGRQPKNPATEAA